MNSDAENVELTEHEGSVEIYVKVVPGASRDRIVGVWETALRVAVAAPPEQGKANRNLVRLLADAFGAKRADVEITRGQTQPLKRVRIAGISPQRARQILAAILASAK